MKTETDELPEYIKEIHRKVDRYDPIKAFYFRKSPGFGKYPCPDSTDEKSLQNFWEFQHHFNYSKRVILYPLLLAEYMQQFEDSIELDFVDEEITLQKNNLIQAIPSDDKQSQSAIWLRRYCEFLEEKRNSLLNPTESQNINGQKGKICYPNNKSETIGIFIGFSDSGLLPFETDYKLAQFLEKHVLYDKDKPLTNCKQEISKYRNHERECGKIEDIFKEKASDFKIRTNDNFN